MDKSKEKKAESTVKQLAIIRPHCGAIDVGSMRMMVSYQDSQGKQKIIEFLAYTSDLHELVDLLKKEGVDHIAMEATGSYWICLHDFLVSAGINVLLVNARHFKNVDAQKTDVKDAQWLHQLNAHGLLRGSHIAPEEYRELRSYIDERGRFQDSKSETLNRIHKVLTLMNVKLQHIISDIEGVSGMNIIRKISQRITNPEELLRDINISQLKASKEELVKSLEGKFKPHLIEILNLQLNTYDFYKKQMRVCEVLIEDLLNKLVPFDENGNKIKISSKKSYSRKNQYSFNLKEYLTRIVGTDLTEIDGIDESTVLTIISIVGIDVSKWKTAEHFVSWLNLTPRIKKSGGKIIGHQQRFTNNAATQALRLAARSLWNNKGNLGKLYRRLAATKGSSKAIKALARRLAVIIYHMIKKNSKYEPYKTCMDEDRYKIQKLKRLTKEAEKLGYNLIKAA
jgi:transposase